MVKHILIGYGAQSGSCDKQDTVIICINMKGNFAYILLKSQGVKCIIRLRQNTPR